MTDIVDLRTKADRWPKQLVPTLANKAERVDAVITDRNRLGLLCYQN